MEKPKDVLNINEPTSYLDIPKSTFYRLAREGKIPDVTLPMTAIRRLDCLLEPTKIAVSAMKKQLDTDQISPEGR